MYDVLLSRTRLIYTAGHIPSLAAQVQPPYISCRPQFGKLPAKLKYHYASTLDWFFFHFLFHQSPNECSVWCFRLVT